MHQGFYSARDGFSLPNFQLRDFTGWDLISFWSKRTNIADTISQFDMSLPLRLTESKRMMFEYQLSFLDPVHRVQVGCVCYQAENDIAAVEQARRQHFYLPAELHRTGELVASFEQESAPVEPGKGST